MAAMRSSPSPLPAAWVKAGNTAAGEQAKAFQCRGGAYTHIDIGIAQKGHQAGTTAPAEVGEAGPGSGWRPSEQRGLDHTGP